VSFYGKAPPKPALVVILSVFILFNQSVFGPNRLLDSCDWVFKSSLFIASDLNYSIIALLAVVVTFTEDVMFVSVGPVCKPD